MSCRLVDFVDSNPELVKHVHRVQVKVPPITDLEWLKFTLAHEQSTVRLTQPEKSWTNAQRSKVYDALIQPTKPWICGQNSEWQKINQVRAYMQNIFNRLISLQLTSATQDITRVLPGLRHLESGLSTYPEQKLAELEHKLFLDDGISVSPDCRIADNENHQQFAAAFYIVLNNATKTINSLKLRDISFNETPSAAMIPGYLQHLDLELRICIYGQFGFSAWDLRLETASEEGQVNPSTLWRQCLRRLKQLQTLRLGLLGGGGRATEYEEEQDHVHQPFYVDDLLADLDNAKDDCFFPKLKSLELFDCTLQTSGLIKVAEKHRKTLRKLILTRVTFAPKYSSSWCDIADMCKGALPGLTYFRLTKVVTSPPKRFQNRYALQYLDDKVRPEGWRSGLDDQMTYEWTRGDTNGAGQELIGSKCPWNCDEEGNELT